ncbi:MAG: selenium-dependent molybdenum cofactor biosynthesis protein YqeB [Actinomycetota bacterium]|nr:selenium-dependent molybdenum cofactor biosynthesis protein YqeB [Actinomycetota bacterium]
MIAPPFARCLCLLRGGGDLGTGVAWRLAKVGFPVVVVELPKPLTVRRAVSLSSAVTDGEVEVEGLRGVRADTGRAMAEALLAGAVPVMTGVDVADIDPVVVIDARLAKRNIDTTIMDADLVVALGPGFTAGVDCHAVIETQRGHRLGRALWSGAAAPNTGTPGVVGGRGAERVLRSPSAGIVRWSVEIGSRVVAGQVLGHVDGQSISAPFAGVVRGLILDGSAVATGLKIGDVDPRLDVACDEISDKALAVGGGVLEVVTGWWAGRPEVR